MIKIVLLGAIEVVQNVHVDFY